MAIKITDLNNGGTPQSTDEIPVARGLTTVKVRLNELNNAKLIANIPSGTFTELISARVGLTDAFRIRAGSITDNTGEVEIATGDDGTEQIHVRQYTGNLANPFSSLLRTLTLLDNNGYTNIPSRLYINTSSGSSNLNVNGGVAFTGSSSPVLQVSQTSSGLGIQTNKIGLNTTNSLYELTVIGSVSASNNIWLETTPTDDKHVTNKKYVDNSITSLNITGYANLSNAQTFTNTNTFNKTVTFNGTTNFVLSAANTTYSISGIPVFIENPGLTPQQMYFRRPTEIRDIIGAEPRISTLPVNRGGTGAVSFTTGQVLVGNSTGAVSTISRDSIDTRTMFPTRKHVIVVGGTGAVSFSAIHNWDTKDVIVTVYENNSPFRVVYPEIQHEHPNAIKVTFTTPPSVDAYRVVVLG